MKNKKKLLIFFIVLIMIILVITSIIIIKNIKPENTELTQNSSQDENKEKNIENSQYIGIDLCFLGEFTDGKWYSANEFNVNTDDVMSFNINTNINVNKKEYSYKDILDKEYFYLYDGDNKKLIEKSNELFYEQEEAPEYYSEINSFRFKVSEELMQSHTLCTSNELEGLQETEILEITDFTEYEKYVEEILVKNKIEDEINIQEVVQVDTNADGKKETYILANTDILKFESGDITDVYNLLLKLENDSCEVIIEKFLNKEMIETDDSNLIEAYSKISSMNFVDFNNDGKLEIYVETGVWDVPETYVFTYNSNDKLELCMYGNFAW